jgi:pyridinium-3,5-biscarboxylic acid mononucleotide sulfurtransferase
LVTQNDLETKAYVDNGVNRCYFCRNNLATEILPIAKRNSVSVCVDGTHVDDIRVPRPGIRALREAGFRAPFADLGIGKDAIRLAARSVGLSNWNRPSEACLSSRVAFGQKIDLETLRRIESAEKIVKQLTNAKIVRVRTIGKRASVEVDRPSLSTTLSKRSKITRALTQLGYSEVEIDLSGYSPGKMLELFVNESL